MQTNLVENSFTQYTVGKCVGEHLYLHFSALHALLPFWRQRIDLAAKLVQASEGEDFNVVKLNKQRNELSLLSYPDFFESAFPELSCSWRVSLAHATVVYRRYDESGNPPILHRKELLLLPDDPRAVNFRSLTEAAESLGLFNDPHRIGTREYWFKLIEQRGYEIQGHTLVPIANELSFVESVQVDGKEIRRHLTALSRRGFSAPVQALLRHGLLNTSEKFFDFGCGKGDDVRELQSNGIDATGWDPHYACDASKRHADAVNLGFVINVIEDLAERIDALRSAYSYADSVLSVAAMLSSQIPPDGKPYRDGYVSSRQTFQKYYSQTQLRDFIEQTLDEPAIAVGPGVFLVFRNKELEQKFLSERYSGHSHNTATRGWAFERIKRESRPLLGSKERKSRVSPEDLLFESQRDTFLATWDRCLELGRLSEPADLQPRLLQTIQANIGSLKRALRICLKRFNYIELERAAVKKRSDLIVFAAMHQFQKRRPYSQIDERMRRDIRYFYSHYENLQALARQELFALTNLESINASCKLAAENGFGWFEESQSLQVHTSLISRLPSNLRVFIGCATALYGDISEFDLLKIHIRSGKVTLMKFEGFIDSPLPRLIERVKVKLKELDLEIFNYGGSYPAPLLYRKSRFINEEICFFSEQVAFDDKLEQLGFLDFQNYGPSAEQFIANLHAKRWDLQGYELVRFQNVPNLDDLCGVHFTYRDLIECGDTQRVTNNANLPRHPDTYTALYELATNILDPLIEYFGMIKLTFGFCSASLAKDIKTGIAPRLDQHAGHETNYLSKPICKRLGIACDFIVENEDMEEVAEWLVTNTAFDRIYFYGKEKPIHVSYSETPARQIVRLGETPAGKRIPKSVLRIK